MSYLESVDRRLLNILLDADCLLAEADSQDPHAFYALLHRTAERLGPADAFYVALHCPAAQTIAFPYNMDDGVFDDPCTLPLGNGPTSQVIRSGQCLRWNSLAERNALSLVPFGDCSRPSHSALHVPMRCGYAPIQPVGVLSVQAYYPQAYDTDTMRLIQWLADQAGRAIERRRTLAAAHEQAQIAEQRRAAMGNRCVNVLRDIEREVAQMQSLVLPKNPRLVQSLKQLQRTCQGAQTITSHFSATPSDISPMPSRPPTAPAVQLTERESDILRLLGTGASNAEIAGALFISANTVKFHCKSIFRKLRVRNRFEAARLCS